MVGATYPAFREGDLVCIVVDTGVVGTVSFDCGGGFLDNRLVWDGLMFGGVGVLRRDLNRGGGDSWRLVRVI